MIGYIDNKQFYLIFKKEIHHTKGLCYVSLKDYNSAIESFQTANSINKHETTYKFSNQFFV